MMGGALGLAVLASIAAARANDGGIAGQPSLSALTDGYHAAFAVGAAFAIGAAVLGLKVLHTRTEPAANRDGDFEDPATSAAAE